MDTFWLIWNPRGRAPTVQHDTYDAAVREAKRLAQIAPGSKFYILQAKDVVQTIDPVEIKPLLEIPF